MASPTSFFRTYDAGWPGDASKAGLTEQLSPVITLLDPDDTPTYAMLPKEEISTVQFDWPIDTLAATSTAAASEGLDFTATALTARTRYKNSTQIFATGFAVTRTQQVVARKGGVTGVRSEYEYQLGKKMKELHRNINARILANTTAVASATASSADRLMGAIRAFPIYATNVSGVFATGSFAALDELMDSGGANPDTVIASSGVKADITNLILNNNGSSFGSSALRRVNMDQEDNMWGGTITVIQNDFGRKMIVRDRWAPQATATVPASADAAAYFLLDRSMVKVCLLDAPTHVPLPPSGLSERGMVTAEISLKVLHPSAVGVGYNCIT